MFRTSAVPVFVTQPMLVCPIRCRTSAVFTFSRTSLIGGTGLISFGQLSLAATLGDSRLRFFCQSLTRPRFRSRENLALLALASTLSARPTKSLLRRLARMHCPDQKLGARVASSERLRPRLIEGAALDGLLDFFDQVLGMTERWPYQRCWNTIAHHFLAIGGTLQ